MASSRKHLQISRRKALFAGACLLGLGSASWAAPRILGDGHTGTASQRARADPRAVNQVVTRAPRIALTFDDGPDPQFTPSVLRLLAQYEVAATFFIIGRNARQHPDLVQDILEDGHHVANHTEDHLWLDSEPPARVLEQITLGDESLAAIHASSDGLFRPPRGWTSPAIAEATRQLGFTSVFWTDCLEAHFDHGIDGAADAIIDGAEPGSIILAHDGGALAGPNPQQEDRSRTVAALPRMLEGLLAKGLRPIPLRDLIALRQ